MTETLEAVGIVVDLDCRERKGGGRVRDERCRE